VFCQKLPAMASCTLMKVGVGGSICTITEARYSGVCAKATRSPMAKPSAAAVTRKAALFQSSPP